ncbi:MAG: hypothetical protein MZV70_05620, partial [Desulfobacterales bacterium]|nr:hypothetical protein [Desulfobacterales bacterium]
KLRIAKVKQTTTNGIDSTWAADHLMEDILYWKFQYPDIRGATDRPGDRGEPVPPARSIRCWMRIIESNPAAFERLAAALNVQLQAAGRGLHRRHRPLPAGRHALPGRRPPPHLLRRQTAPADAVPCTSTRSGAEGELRAGLDPHRRDARAARTH